MIEGLYTRRIANTTKIGGKNKKRIQAILRLPSVFRIFHRRPLEFFDSIISKPSAKVNTLRKTRRKNCCKKVSKIKKETVHKLVRWCTSSYEADLPFLCIIISKPFTKVNTLRKTRRKYCEYCEFSYFSKF